MSSAHTSMLSRYLKRPGLGAALAIAALLLSAHASANDARGTCFNRREWKGLWKTAPDARTMYIKVSYRVYRLDLDDAYPLLKSPWALLSNSDASNVICSPIDFRLVVSDRIGVRQAIIVRHMSVLTPAEAGALPKDLRPL